MGDVARQRVFFEVEFGGRSAGRVEFELFNDVLPRTCENFKCLCTAERGGRLSYAGCAFHRVIRNFMIQGGDFTRGDGTGGESIYGAKFADEGFQFRHESPYLLSMANAGPNTNSSQFFITLRATPHLDGKHVVFGRCVSGSEIVDAIAKVAVDNSDRPMVAVSVAACGLVAESAPAAPAAEAADATAATAPAHAAEAAAEDDAADDEPEEDEENDESLFEGKTDLEKRLLKLRMAMNKGRKANAVATKTERAKSKDPRSGTAAKSAERTANKEAWKTELAARGVDASQSYLFESADAAGRRTAKLQLKDKRKAAFGWDVFNADSLHRAYERRIDQLPARAAGDDSADDGLAYGSAPPPSAEALANMAGELDKRAKAAANFSRRRAETPGADVDYINDRNAVFNKKIKRAFDKYTVEIRQNIERGTAI
ncbi:cyclophilin-like domain-containing protein [Pelagophyceae sp. CCMP2097]|nr:cyclophilin-like domain-containing protein [Pelagophyceae sp. CCMP2097]